MTMQSIEPLHTAKRVSRLVEISAPSAFLELMTMTAGKHPATLTDTIFSLSHRDLARRCRPSQSMKYTCMLKIVTGLPWEHFQFLIFCVVISRSSLPLATSLCAPGMRQYRLQLNSPRFFTHLEPSRPNIRTPQD